jgi:hypothetical protein
LPWMLSRRSTPVNADQLGLSLKITPYCGG